MNDKKKIKISRHNDEINKNLISWNKKKILRHIYYDFFNIINEQIDYNINGVIIEIGSGIAKIKDVIPSCICTDIFENPWIDKVENAYKLSFNDQSVSNIILFDVFHHIEYPANALREFKRVLKNNGRIIIFEPSMSLLGLFVYGIFHNEPINLIKKINQNIVQDEIAINGSYYAAQGNAYRIFMNKNKYSFLLKDWELLTIKRYSSISYVASGGFSKPQLYPDSFYKFMKIIDKFCDLLPSIFSTRILITLKKKENNLYDE